MSHWTEDSIFYHIYPLGLCGAPVNNDLHSRPVSRIKVLFKWIDHISSMGINALYIGPLFESTSHGYDTIDYFMVDRRLGTNDDLIEFVKYCHKAGVRVLFDAVFNHIGRDHFAFKNLQQNGWNSPYREWFFTNFDKRSSFGDPFWYDGWNGHYNLVKLNLKNDSVKSHIFDVIKFWINTFDIDGLRIDAADCIDKSFFEELRTVCTGVKDDFWMVGEIIHGNYRDWANDKRLNSVTNYECYKGLWSSHNDFNYFEIAYSFERQYGNYGIYKGLTLYNFADNHDVDRVGTVLKEPMHIYPLYLLLFTMPGVPSIYYGSEWGIKGKKTSGSDIALRPAINLEEQKKSDEGKDIFGAINRFIALRKELMALTKGSYKQIRVESKQFAFMRECSGNSVVVAVNSSSEEVKFDCKIPLTDNTILVDRLNENKRYEVKNGTVSIHMYPCWGAILVLE